LLERLVVSQLLSQYTDTHFDTRAVGHLQTPAIKLPSHLLIVHCRLVLAVETQQRNGEKRGGTGRNGRAIARLFLGIHRQHPTNGSDPYLLVLPCCKQNQTGKPGNEARLEWE